METISWRPPTRHISRHLKTLRNKYDIKAETLGCDTGDKKKVIILNKVVRIPDSGLELEADPRHAERFIRELG